MAGALAFVLVIIIIVGFHESAHFLFMKLWGVKVIRFSIGFGPVLVRKRIGETEYQLAAIPLGGYVLPLSERLNELKEYDKHSEPNHPEKYFESKPAWQRMVIYLVGPLSNFLFAFLLYFALFAFVGLPEPTTTLAVVAENSPAEQAGIKVGDKIESINGAPIKIWEDIATNIQKNNGNSVKIAVVRDIGKIELTVVPKEEKIESGKRFIIGIAPTNNYIKMNSVGALKEAVVDTIGATLAYANFFKELFTGKAKRDSFGGPIMIYQMTSESVKRGWMETIGLMIMINMSLFVFNILPIPLLDGGQIYPALVEMITGLKPSKRFNAIWNNIGIALLGFLFLLAMFNDLVRAF